MSKTDYSVEDFVLDQDFKKWVLNPDTEGKIYWEEYLKNNPVKSHDIFLARKILLNMSRKTLLVSEERISDTWVKIENALDGMSTENFEGKVIPLDSYTSVKKYEIPPRPIVRYNQFYRIAAIFTTVFILAISLNYLSLSKNPVLSEIDIEYREHIVPPGVKSSLTLMDGSKVILNSGSSLRYVKNFDAHQREVELIGEGYFEVSKDPNRPFIVRTGAVSTQVLGTSFNIKAFENEMLEVSLLTGHVAVEVQSNRPQKISLAPGEAIKFNKDKQTIEKGSFDKDKVLAWTQKTIVFDNTHMYEIKRVLENWYGVEIQFINQPSKDLEITARFNDQKSKDVLEGLSYSLRFQFEIQKDQVKITFK